MRNLILTATILVAGASFALAQGGMGGGMMGGGGEIKFLKIDETCYHCS